jgi:TolB protein
MFRFGTRLGFFVLFFVAGVLGAQSIDGQLRDVTGTVRRDQLRIEIESPRADLKAYIQRAFSYHGAFELSAGQRPQFVFRFDPVSEQSLDLVILSAGKELLRKRFAGDDLFAAAAAAADTAVLRTTNRPGFFSGRVAYISTSSGKPEVYLSDLLMRTRLQMTRHGAETILPALAPDGSQLLYTSYYRNGFPDMYAVNLFSKKMSLFSGYRGMNTGATFRGDSQRVALIISVDGNAEVFSASPEGGQMQRLTKTSALESDPSWSPDGRQITFASDELGRPQIFIMNADGSGRRRLPTNVSRNCSEPTWNPVDARQIAFTAAVGSEFEICLYEMGGSAAKILTQGAGDAIEPVWLSDGRHILFTQRSKGRSRLAILDTMTGSQKVLSPDAWGNCSMADFAPAK